MSQKNNIKFACGKGEKWIINETQKLTNHFDKLVFYCKNNNMHYNTNLQFKNVVKKLLKNKQRVCDKKQYKESCEEKCSIVICESKKLIMANDKENEDYYINKNNSNKIKNDKSLETDKKLKKSIEKLKVNKKQQSKRRHTSPRRVIIETIPDCPNAPIIPGVVLTYSGCLFANDVFSYQLTDQRKVI